MESEIEEIEIIDERGKSKTPKISVIVYDGSFRERFFQLDSLEEQTISQDVFQYIWVENFHTIDDQLREKLRNSSLAFKLITLNRDISYHLSKCVNCGIREADADIVAVADADTYFEPDVLRQTLAHHKSNPYSVLYIRRFDEPQPPMLRKQEITLPRLVVRCELLAENNFGGFMSIRKKNYIESGGYEEHPIFSGSDSAGALDLKTRFENMGLFWRWHPELKVYHICHENAFGEDRWDGFRVESQWKIIKQRKEEKLVKPLIGYKGRYRELGERWEDWLGKWDKESIDYRSPLDE